MIGGMMFQLFIEGVCVEHIHVVSFDDPDANARMAAMIQRRDAAIDAGEKWVVNVIDPDAPQERNTICFGDDESMLGPGFQRLPADHTAAQDQLEAAVRHMIDAGAR